MARYKVAKKTDPVEKTNFYFGLKSQNEIYYQMASIFKQTADDEDEMAKNIFTRVLTENESKIFLDKPF